MRMFLLRNSCDPYSASQEHLRFWSYQRIGGTKERSSYKRDHSRWLRSLHDFFSVVLFKPRLRFAVIEEARPLLIMLHGRLYTPPTHYNRSLKIIKHCDSCAEFEIAFGKNTNPNRFPFFFFSFPSHFFISTHDSYRLIDIRLYTYTLYKVDIMIRNVCPRDEFDFKEVIGAGSFGSVRRAVQKASQKVVRWKACVGYESLSHLCCIRWLSR